jgi:hypothetical protein
MPTPLGSYVSPAADPNVFHASDRSRAAMVDTAEISAVTDVRPDLEPIFGNDRLYPCPETLESQWWSNGGYMATWESPDEAVTVSQYVASLLRDGQILRAVGALAEIRARLTCQTYLSREGTPTVTGEFSLPILPGVEAQYAFCERIDDRGACTAYVAKDEQISRIRVLTRSEQEAKSMIGSLAAIAAKRLSAASRNR